jgi:hypothetical protein
MFPATDSRRRLLKAAITLMAFAGLAFVANDFASAGWGSGHWLARFSIQWAAVIVAFILFLLSIFTLCHGAIWDTAWHRTLAGKFLNLRARLNVLRWAIVPVLAILPAWMLAFTSMGSLFTGAWIRLFIFIFSALAIGLIVTQEKLLLSWTALLAGVILPAAAFSCAEILQTAVPYPFSLTWSEGNRMWDYSLLFGRARYDMSGEVTSTMDNARRLLWGLPFIVPGVSIQFVRLWNNLIFNLPYFIFGLVLFRHLRSNRWLWLGVSMWAWLFLAQGPIYSTLLVCALLVAFAWKRSDWIALPLIFLAGWLAFVSRWTWMFAPALWALIIAFADSAEGRATSAHWRRGILYSSAGLLGGVVLPLAWNKIQQWLAGASEANFSPDLVANQPLLWYRLFPNATYGPGLLLAALQAAAPLAILLIYLRVRSKWKLDLWQGLAVAGCLIVFAGAGLVISLKIGGGSNLHNLDMFFVGLLFALAVAWRQGALGIAQKDADVSTWARALILIVVLIPALRSPLIIRPLDLPPAENTGRWLAIIQQEVADAQGPVLFMDERQLITFGYIRGVTMIPEYDKRYMTDLAMANDEKSFRQYYADLAAHRFALIVADPLKLATFGDERNFGEENDAWVRWVAEPTLRYYQPLYTFDKIGVELLVPRP